VSVKFGSKINERDNEILIW